MNVSFIDSNHVSRVNYSDKPQTRLLIRLPLLLPPPHTNKNLSIKLVVGILWWNWNTCGTYRINFGFDRTSQTETRFKIRSCCTCKIRLDDVSLLTSAARPELIPWYISGDATPSGVFLAARRTKWLSCWASSYFRFIFSVAHSLYLKFPLFDPSSSIGSLFSFIFFSLRFFSDSLVSFSAILLSILPSSPSLCLSVCLSLFLNLFFPSSLSSSTSVQVFHRGFPVTPISVCFSFNS